VLVGELWRTSAEGVVPIVERRRAQLDGGMKSDHGLGHGLAGGIEIEAAPEAATLVKEVRQPSGVGSGASGGEATVVGMKEVAAEGVDGRFAEDDVGTRSGRKGEEAEIFTGARSHAAPRNGTGAAQFGADRLAVGVAQQEEGVGFGIGVEVTGASQGLDQRKGQGALLDEVAAKGVEAAWHGQGQA